MDNCGVSIVFTPKGLEARNFSERLGTHGVEALNGWPPIRWGGRTTTLPVGRASSVARTGYSLPCLAPRTAKRHDHRGRGDGGSQGQILILPRLRPHLTGRDGFPSSERFQSLTSPGKVLSLSFWRDEAAVAAAPSRIEGAEVECTYAAVSSVRLPWRQTVDQLHQRRNCRTELDPASHRSCQRRDRSVTEGLVAGDVAGMVGPL